MKDSGTGIDGGKRLHRGSHVSKFLDRRLSGHGSVHFCLVCSDNLAELVDQAAIIKFSLPLVNGTEVLILQLLVLQRDLGRHRLDRNFLPLLREVRQGNVLLANANVDADGLRIDAVILEGRLHRRILLGLFLDILVEALDVVVVQNALDLALLFGCGASDVRQVRLRVVAGPQVVLLVGLRSLGCGCLVLVKDLTLGSV